MGLTEKQAPFSEPYALAGNPKGFRSKGPTAEAVKRALAHLKFMAWKEDGDWDQHWNVEVNDAAGRWKAKRGISNAADGSWGEYAHSVMRTAWYAKQGDHLPAFDGHAQELLRNEAAGPETPQLGPTFTGGKSVLGHDLTHATSGIPLYPAFDDAFDEGVTIIAPEDLEVTKASSSSPGDACYAEGVSGLRWWFGHLTAAPAVGTKIKQGGKVGVTCQNSYGGGPHVHVAVNVEKLWGAGKQMSHHTNYTHGAPPIGDQLRAGKPL